MLQVSAALGTAISESTIAPFAVVKFEFTSGDINITDAPHDVVYQSETYTASGGLKSLSPPNNNNELSRDLFFIELTDHDSAFRTELDQENIGVPITIKSGFIDITTNLIISEYIDVYHGKISKVSWELVDNEEPIINIECSGPFVKLQQIINRTTSEKSQKSVYPNDTSMDKSYDTENEATIKWGGLT